MPVGLSRWTVAAYQVVADRLRVVEKTTGRPVRLLALADIVTEREAETLRKFPGWTMTQHGDFQERGNPQRDEQREGPKGHR